MKDEKKLKKSYIHKNTGLSRTLVWFFSKVIVGKMEFIFHDKKPTEASFLVGNHTKFFAPLAIQYKYPGWVRTWSNAFMLDSKSCSEHFKKILKGIKGERFYKLILPIMAPSIARYYRKHLNCIPVYHDIQVSKTFEMSIDTLKNGVHLAVYPELREKPFNEFICRIATGFIYLAYNYYKKTGNKLDFYPFYCAPALKQTHFGKPISYDPDLSIKEQATIIASYLETQITELAQALPPHKIHSIANYLKKEDSKK